MTGTRVRLADEVGTVRTVTAAEMACDLRFETNINMYSSWRKIDEVGLNSPAQER